MGRYNDRLGATSVDDCLLCPPGTFGKTEGLKTADCSNSCYILNPGKYSDAWGLTTDADCKQCEPGYQGWQCEWQLKARKGTFKSATGAINEYAHYYLDATRNTKNGQQTGDDDILPDKYRYEYLYFPDGEWSADRYSQDYAGKWDRGKGAGAYPPNSPYMSGRPDQHLEDILFDPSPQKYKPVK